jgi:chromosome segregation ATPase
MKMRLIMTPILLCSVTLLAGCAVDKAGCDPKAMRDAGLLTKMNCDFSGSYDARAADKNAQLQAEQKNNELLKQALADLSKKNDLVSADVTARRSQVAGMNRSVSAYLVQIKNSNPNNVALQAQVAKATAQLNALNSTPISSSPASTQALQAQIDKVQKEIQTLGNDYAILSK